MGYISKDHGTEQIIDAIRRVLEGKVFLSEPMADRVLNRAVGKGSSGVGQSPVESLSDRELEVFRLIGKGLDTNQIAASMCVSPKTVETYRTRVKEKFNLTSRAALIQRAVQWVVENG